MKKAKVGIIGGAGYTGGELLRLLLNHEGVEIDFVQSRSQDGRPVDSVHTDLKGVTNLAFTNDPKVFRSPSVDVVFLALPHGEARAFVEANPYDSRVKVIDLSNDFRLHADAQVAGREFVYGLPELNRKAIQKSNSIANPGCFATAIQLALLPLAAEKKLSNVVVTGITGSTGAGQKLAETSHFSFRANNIQAYKTLSHQHMGEVNESLVSLHGKPTKISFIPWRGDFTRGIFVSACLEVDASLKTLELFQKYYEGHPFVWVGTSAIDLKSVVNTNRAQIEICQKGSDLVVHVVIDNLLKGASGQAIQNMNLMLGFDEMAGLRLKGTAF